MSRLLLDTHVLLWAIAKPELLSANVIEELADPANEVFYSAATLWEISIKVALGRADFNVSPTRVMRMAADVGIASLPVLDAHGIATLDLPPIHRDPFDRLLVAQARSEPMTLLTRDTTLAKYGDHVRLI